MARAAPASTPPCSRAQLGVRVVPGKSFARIHETNLKQGMLGLTFANEADYDLIREDDSFDLIDLKDFAPGKPLTLVAKHADGSEDTIVCNHTYNAQQIGWLRWFDKNLAQAAERMGLSSACSPSWPVDSTSKGRT